MKWYKQHDCAIIDIKYTPNSKWEQYVLLTSDVHKDSKKCDTHLLKKCFDEALEKNAIIIDNGDWFDVMGGKYDKRTTKGDIKPEFQFGNYFDCVIEDSVEFLKPYAKNIAVLGEGNHEQSVNTRHERNLTKSLIKELNLHGGNIIHQQYAGFIKFQFLGLRKNSIGGRTSLTMYRHHGMGGNAPVTMGVINTNRTQIQIDADIYVYGHIHQKWLVYRTKMGLTNQGKMIVKDQVHIQLSTYKDSKESQWEVSKNFQPPSLGGAWIKFYFCTKERTIKYKVNFI